MITANQIKDKIAIQLKAEYARQPETATAFEFWTALSRSVVEILAENWENSTAKYNQVRQAHYFSAEFLEGRSLVNNLVNLNMYEAVREAVATFGYDLTTLEEQENDAALGNGGLGRLAACFLDSCSTLNLPVTGYGILYRYGLFRQGIDNGFQKEFPDVWMEKGYPFVVRRDADKMLIHYQDMDVFAVPYDMPITGFGTNNVNTLRLWRAEPAEEFDFNLFNSQRFDDAVLARNRVNDIFRVLYPNDTSYDGKVLRVRQQYFFVSASLQSIIRDHKRAHGNDLTNFAALHSIQLNDTHPVVGIPELMRLLIDENGMTWDAAWAITTQTFAYTNHTVMAEALEKWDISIFQFLFPRVLEIIGQIDAKFRSDLQAKGVQYDRINYLAPMGDGKIRMAWLAVYGAFSVNGVAALHTNILKQDTLRDFFEIWPEKFSNKTNGVTPRRWLRTCNPELSSLLTKLNGDESWVTHLDKLAVLEKYTADESVMRSFLDIKRQSKVKLAAYIARVEGVQIDPDSIFDVQIKRLHEYKRQLLNALDVLDTYFQLKDNPSLDLVPRTYIFAAKAAPGYFKAKATIKFINEIARLVNNDNDANKKIKVVFMRNYNVSRAEVIFPASDLSEQISTVGLEASGTGNMKFMMNGALTIGTYDGANIEIADSVGPENCFIFGQKVEEFYASKSYYNPQWQYNNISGLKRVLDTLVDGTFNDEGTGMFQDLFNGLINGSNWQPADPFYVLGDFEDYRRARKATDLAYRDQLSWARKCWVNIVRSGHFSSDRTIREYADEIWHVEATKL
ncbi:MAG: glycogen/starch/alpha-glucan phosphorylase [Eubacteriales bacterium]|nr:glycogen/starch/alpha-glucan phosphorylase [Eubacteriales bacterium]